MRQRPAGTGVSRRACLALPLAAALAACGSGGADQALERTASWAATARLVADSRAAGATSHQYARVALHAAHAELGASASALGEALRSPGKAGALDAAQRARALAAAREAERAVGEMADVAERAPGDVPALARLAAHAERAGRTAKALSDSAATP